MEQMPKDEWVVIPEDKLLVEALKSFTTLEEIEALEGEMLAHKSVPIHVKHSFAAGIYAREITLPAGVVAIGHAHTEECLNIVTKGSVSVLLEGEMVRVSAPATFPSAPFSRKVGYVHEDLTWITVHPIKERSIDKIESQIIAKSDTFKRHEALLEGQCAALAAISADEGWSDRIDYLSALKDLGFTQKQVDEMVHNEEDQIELPEDFQALTYRGSSEIHGTGVFSSFAFPVGRNLGPCRIGGYRTHLGRYTNHAQFPNAKFELGHNGRVNTIAIRKILPGDEITVNYRDAFLVAREADKVLINLTN